MTYQSLAGISGPAYQTVSFIQQNIDGYDVEYICESAPGAEYTEPLWRISRTRFLSGQNILVDRMFAVNNLAGNEEMSTFNKGTAEFIFPVVDQDTVLAYHYGPSI